jgi:hypothetical protein
VLYWAPLDSLPYCERALQNAMLTSVRKHNSMNLSV